MAPPPITACTVACFIPNIIGYARLVLLIAATFVARDSPVAFISLYTASVALDAFDGMAARALNQQSRFGEVLDMVLDRASNSILFVVLGSLYTDQVWLWGGLAAIDLVSHYAHMYANLALEHYHGRVHGSHKEIESRKPWVLQLYYGRKAILGTIVAGAEILYLAAYGLYFAEEGSPIANFLTLSLWFGILVGGCKQILNVIQAVEAFKDIASIDVSIRKEMRLTE